MSPSRFWPLAALILLPVLVLAGVAAYGLQDQWNRNHDRARVEGGKFARKAAATWADMLTRVHGMRVALYSPTPVPGPAGKEAGELEKAVTAGDVAELQRLSRIETGQPLTQSGLPVRLLAAWHLWQRTAADDDARTLGMLATTRDPCALSPKIIESLDVAAAAARPGPETSWMVIWKALEQGRRLAAQMPAHLQRTLWREGDHQRAWIVRGAGGDGFEVSDDADLETLYHDVAQSLRDDTPAWAAWVVHADGRIYGPAAARHGEPDFGAEMAGEFFRIEVLLKDHAAFTADYSRLVYWTWSVVITALLTALLGLWLVRRTLTKERRLGELKSRFVSSVSHELRAPVGSLRLMADGLASGKVTGAAADEFHRLMAGEGARLSSLIENVLDFARIEQGRKEYHLAETDLAALIHDAVKLMQPQAEARGLRIHCALETLTFVPRVDAGALQQALINLLDNAIKFTPGEGVKVESECESESEGEGEGGGGEGGGGEGGGGEGGGGEGAAGGSQTPLSLSTFTFTPPIRVRLAAEPRGWSLTVTDHGPGIPREEHTRIFERFYRLGHELRRETTGTGIGLAIVQHIVEGHGGRISVQSEMGKGSAFRMVFSESESGK